MKRMVMGGVVLAILVWATGARAQSETCPGQDVDLSGLGRCSGGGVTENGTTTGVSDDIDESAVVACWGTGNSDAPEVVYSFTLSHGRYLQIDLEDSNYDTKMAIVQGCPDGGNFCIYNDDYDPQLGFYSGFDCRYFDAGTYSVIVSGYGGRTGDFVLHIDECEQGCSENDFCPGEGLDMSSIHTCGGATVQVTGSTVDATDDIDESSEVSCWGGSGAAERVYSFHLDIARSLQIDLEGSVFDTKMAVVQGCPDGGTFCIYNDDYSGLQSGFDCQVFQPGDYSIIVAGYDGEVGDYTLNLTECETNCPGDEVCPGEAVDLSGLTPGSGAEAAVTGSTVDATDDINETAEVSCWVASQAAEKVHSFTLTQDTYLQIDLDGSDYDTKMAVVAGCPAGDAFCRHNDDYHGLISGFDCERYPAGTYSVIVSGFDGRTGNYQLNFTECQPICGNGVLDNGEECDDGNNDDTDACLSTCVAASCGDGHVWAGNEECDDGNTTDGDGCSSTCTLEAVCGNGVLEAGEECDDGNNDDTDACLSTCVAASCGDGHVWAGNEECDDGNNTDGDGCSASCTIEPSCGNGVLDNGEECDDGNSDNTDGCLNTCVAASCGDGYVWAGHEECDDANADNTDDCLDSCVAASCGDGYVWSGHEDCDDGNTTDGDGCSATCTAEPAQCGNGVLEEGEECDDGNADDTDACLSTCVAASCGDGYVWIGHEECDDGNTTDGDGCSSTCQDEGGAVCGNGVVEDGEECDDGNTMDGDGCSSTCENEGEAVCGNGVVEDGEECDDGNTLNGDGCSSTCEDEGEAVCGNGVVEDGEECDDGNTFNGDGCSSTCQNEGGGVCGNGVIEIGETCDDANTFSGDGCSDTCAVEVGWACQGEPSSCCEDANEDGVCDGSGSSSDSGCGCSASGGSRDLGWAFVLLLGLPLIRRRRRQ